MPDPVTLLVSALAAGAATAGKEVVGQAVKDAYHALKSLMVSRYGSDAKLEQSIQAVEEEPSSQGQQLVLKEQVEKTQAPQDAELVQYAQTLLQRLEQAGVKPGSLSQAKLEGSGAIAQGDGSAAAGSGGVAVAGNVTGNISTGGSSGAQ